MYKHFLALKKGPLRKDKFIQRLMCAINNVRNLCALILKIYF